MLLNGCAKYRYCYFAGRCIWWDPEMSHADVRVCDVDQQQNIFKIWKAQVV